MTLGAREKPWNTQPIKLIPLTCIDCFVTPCRISSNILHLFFVMSNKSICFIFQFPLVWPPSIRFTTDHHLILPQLFHLQTLSLYPKMAPARRIIRPHLHQLLLRYRMRNKIYLPRYKRDMIAKIKILGTELQPMQPQSGHCHLEVSRTGIFEVCIAIIYQIHRAVWVIKLDDTTNRNRIGASWNCVQRIYVNGSWSSSAVKKDWIMAALRASGSTFSRNKCSTHIAAYSATHAKIITPYTSIPTAASIR